MAKASIITIGDEILIGQIINTNASWIAQKLTGYGIIVDKHISVSDNKQVIFDTIRTELSRCDIVITTGGLGPTSDDNTKAVICDIFNDTLQFHQPSFENIESLFKARNRTLSERNKLQAMIPSRAIALKNDNGTAPGILFVENDKMFLALPGVPIEMKGIMENYFEPYLIEYLRKHQSKFVLYKTINTTGIYESNLADLIGDPSKFLDKDTSLAFLPNYRGVRLRIGATKNSYEEAKQTVENAIDYLYQKIGKFIISEGELNLPQILFDLLSKHNKTLSIAESCTGGFLGKEITEISGISQYFMGGFITYSNDSKINLLNVNKETIEKYGAVSNQTACEMALNVRRIFNTDYGISITGIAGPTGGTPTKPIGTVFIGLSDINGVEAYEYHFGENRSINRERAVSSAFLLLINKLKQG